MTISNREAAKSLVGGETVMGHRPSAPEYLEMTRRTGVFMDRVSGGLRHAATAASVRRR